MPLEVPHVLVDIDYLGALLVYLVEETLDQLGELRGLVLDHRVVLLVLAPDVREELLEVLGIVHYQLVYDCFVKVDAGKLI